MLLYSATHFKINLRKDFVCLDAFGILRAFYSARKTMYLGDQEIHRLVSYEPRLRKEDSHVHAAISVIARNRGGKTEFLLMQRAEHADDPWSGQMGFPGGKIELSDRNACEAAIRETEEEVNIALTKQQLRGRLDDVLGFKIGSKHAAHLSCFVFQVDNKVNLKGNYEVQDLLWLPFSKLNEEANKIDYRHPKRPDIAMPAFMINPDKQQILWGLSLRVVLQLCRLLDWPTALNEDESRQLRQLEGKRIDQ